MKIVTKFLNLLLLCFTFCLMSFAQWGVYDLLVMPTGMENTIGFVSTDRDNDGIDDNVAYLDTYTFLGEDLVQSVTREPRYLVRSWFDWDWWQNGMKWADYACEAVVGVVVPIFSPMYETGQLITYYSDCTETANIHGLTINGVTELYDTENSDDLDVINLLINSKNKLFSEIEGNEKLDPYKNKLVYFENNAYRKGLCFKVGSKVEQMFEMDLDKSLTDKDNIYALNTIYSIQKYNETDVYDKWVNKFLEKDMFGFYQVKTSVYSLYFQFFMAIILSIWFVCQNPIRIVRNDYGENEIVSGMGHKKRKKAK